MSVSVYSVGLEQWQQTWVDSDGNYLVFTGGFRAGTMDLRTERLVGDRPVPHRMLWHSIEADSFQLEWERMGPDGA
jgi:hypothetical protein